MARYPHSTDQAEQKCPPPGFDTQEGGEEVRLRSRAKEGQSGTQSGRTALYPTCPLAVCLSGRLEVKLFFFGTHENFATTCVEYLL